MLQAMNTGHDGSLSTCHANSPADALRRLETMVLIGTVALPLAAIREQLSSAVDLVVQVARRRDGTRRVVEIAEVTDDASRTRTIVDEHGVVAGTTRGARRWSA
jgi:pilus assembly protein CpaF